MEIYSFLWCGLLGSLVCPFRLLVRSFHCFAITSSHGKFTFSRHVLFFCLFLLCDEIIYFAHFGWRLLCIWFLSVMWSRIFAMVCVMLQCVCVCFVYVWRCWVKTCVTEWQSLRMNMMTGPHCKNFSDYWSILAIRHVVFKLSLYRTFSSHISRYFCYRYYYEFHCVCVRECERTTWSYFNENLPIQLYIGSHRLAGSLSLFLSVYKTIFDSRWLILVKKAQA